MDTVVQNKINIFKNTFYGRRDVVAKFWVSKDGERQGYSPMCKNEWREGICKKLSKKPCRDCQKADYIPLSDQVILEHFKGKHILGVYPLLKDGTCWFTAGDFDDHNNDQNFRASGFPYPTRARGYIESANHARGYFPERRHRHSPGIPCIWKY